MANENFILYKEEVINEEVLELYDFDELQEKLELQLENELSNLEFLKEEKEKIGNPEALGKVMLDEVWSQFSNQIGLDITNETLIQKYDREHQGETYKEVGENVMRDPKYIKANKEMKEKQQSGSLEDEYTGKKISQNENANLDHVVSRKELYENQRRKQANLSTEKLANKDENLKSTNESLNKSKGAKSVDEYLKNKEQREKNLVEQNKRANKKIDESDMSDMEKKRVKEKNNKRLQDKLAADDERMKRADKEAREAINKDIVKGVVKETTKKVGKDALKQMAISALFSLLKEVMNGMVKFLKNKAKSFKNFLEEMKKCINSFFKKLSSVIQTGISSSLGTIVSEIFGPIVSIFKKLASLIKQSVASIIEAIKYLKAKENKNKPFSIKVAQVGKIVTTGLIAVGALFLGEVFEKILMTVPVMLIELPLIGTLANVIGMFLGSLISGIVGAIAISLIEKQVEKSMKRENIDEQLKKGNEILNLQHKVQLVNAVKLEHTKSTVIKNIQIRHTVARDTIEETVENIRANCAINTDIQDTFDDIDDLFKELETI